MPTLELLPDVRFLSEKNWRELLASFADPQFEAGPKRRTRRYPIDGEVQVRYCDDEKMRIRTAVLFDMSSGGLQMRHYEPCIPVYTRLVMYLNLGSEMVALRGTVVHCTGTVGGYKIGVRLGFDE